jgi:arginine N-succinyltransferase
VTHKDTAPARKMLEAEGLRYENHVDIFDAGPVLECHIADLRTVRESVLARVKIGERASSDAKSLVSNTQLDDFRCGATTGAIEDGAFMLSAEEAAALRVGDGDEVRVLTSYPRAV